MTGAQTTPSDLPSLLRGELTRRCKANPRYSLRAFARNLGVDPSLLSKVLQGKRLPSPSFEEQTAERLGISKSQILVGARAKRGRRSRAERFTRSIRPLDEEHFEVLAHWEHFAIFTLATLEDADLRPRAISTRLGISEIQASLALDRLIKLGYLTQDEQTQQWICNSTHLSTLHRHQETTAALKEHQRQQLQNAIQALDTVSLAERDHTGVTMAIDPERLPEAKEKLKKFRREMCEFLESGPQRKRVYQLSLALFPLTQDNVKQESRS